MTKTIKKRNIRSLDDRADLYAPKLAGASKTAT
jgi:hypothetical protein